MTTLTENTLTSISHLDVIHLRKHKVTSVEYISSSIDYDEFFLRFLVPNRPCLFGPHITQGWRSIQEWVTEDGQPNFDYLSQTFGNTVVPVADCREVQYSAQPKSDMQLTEYLKYWQDLRQSQDSADAKCLYLKDWHFTKVFPDYGAYTTPFYCVSDWMNEYWDIKPGPGADDYRFVYMGPKGSWTPFHADVFRSYSWSANICGRKRWFLYPPGQEDHLKDALGNLVYDVTCPELHDVNQYPHYGKAREPFEVIQGPGEVIFVPSGWHHQVFNMEDTISINHNWLNGCNVDLTWAFLQGELVSVKKSISDCIDMDGWDLQCQIIMKASTGIDYSEFLQLLWTVASPRLRLLNQLKEQRSNCEPDPDRGDKGTHVSVECLEHNTGDECQRCGRNVQSEVIEARTSSNKFKDSSCDPCLSHSASFEKPADVSATGVSSFCVADSTSVDADPRENLPQLSDSVRKCILGSQDSSQSSKSLDIRRKSNIWHWIYDLRRIREILTSLLDDEDFGKIEKETLCTDPHEFLREIISAIKDTEYSD